MRGSSFYRLDDKLIEKDLNSIEETKFNDKLHKVYPLDDRVNWLLEKYNYTPKKPPNYTRLIVCILTALSTILTIMLICCYEYPSSLQTNLRDFSIAMICITVIFFVISLVLLLYFGVGDDPNKYKKKAIYICLVVELFDIAGSVLVYLNKLNDF